MKEPNLIINWAAILLAMLSAFFFGGLWYGPIMGKKWAALMGMDMSKKPPPGVMKKAFTLQIIGLFLTCYVLAHMNQVWRPSVWGGGEDGPSYMYGFCGAVFTWVGFYVPMQMSKIAWEMRPNKLFLINASHDLINLLIMSMILAYWR
jgi:hypothetical protein